MYSYRSYKNMFLRVIVLKQNVFHDWTKKTEHAQFVSVSPREAIKRKMLKNVKILQSFLRICLVYQKYATRLYLKQLFSKKLALDIGLYHQRKVRCDICFVFEIKNICKVQHLKKKKRLLLTKCSRQGQFAVKICPVINANKI